MDLMRSRQHIYIAWYWRAWSEKSAGFEPFMPERAPSPAIVTISRMSCPQPTTIYAHMIFAIALAAGWLRKSPSIPWQKI
jgi:hypothetical protein